MSIDARLGYDVWLQLIADEELYRHTIAGTHRELAQSRGFGEPELVILDAFHAERGTRWNIENLRFRTALESRATLESYMPRTCRLLTKGDPDWLQDLVFEYLAFYRWREHGHRRFTECERFGTYVRERVMKRRMTPPYLEDVLTFELGVIALLKSTASITAWPEPPAPLTDEQLAASQITRAPAIALIDLAHDIRAWVTSGDPLTGSVGPDPITFLAYVPSLRDVHKLKLVGEGPRVVLDRLAGPGTVAEIATELDDEYGIEPPQLYAMLRNWLDERIVTATTGAR